MRNIVCGVMATLPVLTSDYFEFFGIERRLDIDTADLQRRFYELSRVLHPDRFQLKSAGERQYSLDATSLLNDAYRVLRESVARAEYLLKQEGFDIGEQRSKDVPPELLEEVFELNMALEEIRGGDSSVRPELEAARDRFAGMMRQNDEQLSTLFRRYDETRSRDVLTELRGALNRRRYIRNLAAEVEKELENVDISN